MTGPSGVVALVLAETAAGGVALLWLAGLWGSVKRGFFILTSSVAFACALLAWLAARGGIVPGTGDAGPAALWLLLATAGLVGVSLAALLVRAGAVGRVAGMAAIPVSLAALVLLAMVVTPSFPVALLQLLAGAAFMGAVTNGLLLGHWYLVDRRLSRDHINRMATLLLAAVVIQAGALVAAGFQPVTPSPGFSPYLGIGNLATWLALGMSAATALVAVMIRATLRGTQARAVQAATGFFYLAVIFAFTAEMAAKVRFTG